ncbi:MAG: hypothetical protein IJY27_01555 [Clostridia bacterium]|nr:hypothetical protein [Clostridia bacterium]
MKKRLILLLLAVCMCASLMSSCVLMYRTRATYKAEPLYVGNPSELTELFDPWDSDSFGGVAGVTPGIKSFVITSGGWEGFRAADHSAWCPEDTSTDLSKYDDEFFEKNYLVLTIIETGHTGYKFDVSGRKISYKTIGIDIVQVHPTARPEASNTAMGFFVYITEMSGKYKEQSIKHRYFRLY